MFYCRNTALKSGLSLVMEVETIFLKQTKKGTRYTFDMEYPRDST